MAVFDVYIVEFDGQVGEVGKHRNINLPDFDRGIQALVGLVHKLLNNAVFE